MQKSRLATRFNETAVSLAVPASVSLRTTILSYVHGKLGIQGGDQISWSCERGRGARVELGDGQYVSKVVEVGGSLRTTVPQEVVRILQIEERDILVWDIDKECDGHGRGRWFATVVKKRQ